MVSAVGNSRRDGSNSVAVTCCCVLCVFLVDIVVVVSPDMIERKSDKGLAFETKAISSGRVAMTLLNVTLVSSRYNG